MQEVSLEQSCPTFSRRGWFEWWPIQFQFRKKFKLISEVSDLVWIVFSLTLKLCASREFITRCSLFQVWFGDNRASIEFHERGKKHKDALAAKLRDLGRAAHEKEQAVGALKFAATHVIYTNGVGLAMENEYGTGGYGSGCAESHEGKRWRHRTRTRPTMWVSLRFCHFCCFLKGF